MSSTTTINKDSKLMVLLLAFFALVFTLITCDNSSNNPDPAVVIVEPDINEVLIASPETIEGGIIAITNVNIISMVSEAVHENRTIIIENGIISEIGPTATIEIPASATVIDALDKGYLIPGLMDMHYHRSTFNDLYLFMANGVTIVREMWGSTGLLDFRERILNENLEVPQVFAASPGMDGEGGALSIFTPPVTTEESGRALVREYALAGFDFIKVYNLLEPNVFAAIMDEAEKEGISVVGHVPVKFGAKEAYQSGLASTEHLLGYGIYASSTNTIFSGNLDMSKVDELVDLSISNDVWHVPTISVDIQSSSSIEAIRNSEEYTYISANLKDLFENVQPFNGFPEPEVSERNHKDVVRRIHQKGGNIMLGTDAGFGFVIPGFSIHRELEHYVDAGLSNYEALRTATVNPSVFLKIENLVGTIEVGKRADLVLLESNPLDDISATRDKAGVMLRGDWYSEAQIRNDLETLANQSN